MSQSSASNYVPVTANGPIKGEIDFVGKGNPDPAKYIIIPKDVAHVNEMETFLDTVLLNEFNLKKPKVLLSVTGGAQDFKMLSSKLEQVFNRGIVRAAENTTAWIITGGLDTGVMEFVGEAIKNQDLYDIPCIGIATYRKISHSHDLSAGGKVYYSQQKANDDYSAALNPNHSHFILVDGTKWGDEIIVRNSLEDFISRTWQVPLVLIVVNGGPGTISTVAEGVAKLFPVIIVEGSGRAADAIADMVTKHKKEIPGPSTLWDDLTKRMKPDDVAKWRQTILDGAHNISIFNPNEDATSDMDLVILRAILTGSRKSDTFRNKLFLGVEWGREDVIRELLERDEESESSDIKREALNHALQMALELNRPEILTLLVEKGADKSTVDLKRLYRLDAVKYLVDRLLPYSGAVNNDVAGDELGTIGNFANVALADHHNEYESVHNKPQIVSKQLESAKKVLKKIHPMYYTLLVDGKTTFTDMLVWAIMVNRHDLAKEIWKNAVLPVHLALVASHLYSTLADWFQGDEDYPVNAQWFESQAIKVLDRMEYDIAKKVLKWEWTELENKSALQVAEIAECKQFLSHQFVQRYLDEVLYSDEHGEVMVGSSSLTVINLIVYPWGKAYTHKPEANTKWYHVYSLPIVKFWSSTLTYILFLALIGAVVIHSGDAEIYYFEYVLWLWVLAILIEEGAQFFEDKESYFDRMSNQMDGFMLVLLVAHIITRIVGIFAYNDPQLLEASADIIIIGALICYVRLLYVFAFSPSLGPLFFVMMRLVKDVAKWVFIYGVFMVSFQLGIMALTQQAGGDMWQTYPNGTFGVSFTTIIGDYGIGMDTLAGTHIGVVFLAVYALVAQIMLVNLLIAMMGDTYSEVKENSDKEWKFFRYSLVCDYCFCSPYPPPFNLIVGPIQTVLGFFSPKPPQTVIVDHGLPYQQVAAEGPPPPTPAKAASDDITIKKMKIAKERILEQQEEDDESSMATLSITIKEHLRLMTNQRDSDRLFVEQSLGAMQLMLADMRTKLNSLAPAQPPPQ